jgi:hypothetical protein
MSLLVLSLQIAILMPGRDQVSRPQKKKAPALRLSSTTELGNWRISR